MQTVRKQPMKRIQPPAAPAAEPARMKNRVVRCDDPTWDDAAAQAAEDGLPLAEVIRHYLRGYGAAKRQSRESV